MFATGVLQCTHPLVTLCSMRGWSLRDNGLSKSGQANRESYPKGYAERCAAPDLHLRHGDGEAVSRLGATAR